LAIIYSLRYFKQYLLGRRFVIRTDHSALTWLRRTPDPIGQQGRWLEIMEEFDFVIEHRPGSRHGNADALSRRPCRVRDCACRAAEQNVSDNRGFSQVAQNPPFTSIGGWADCLPIACLGVVQSIADDKMKSNAAVAETSNDVDGAATDALSWSHDGLRVAQKADPDVSFVMCLVENCENKPEWEKVALSSQCVKMRIVFTADEMDGGRQVEYVSLSTHDKWRSGALSPHAKLDVGESCDGLTTGLGRATAVGVGSLPGVAA